MDVIFSKSKDENKFSKVMKLNLRFVWYNLLWGVMQGFSPKEKKRVWCKEMLGVMLRFFFFFFFFPSLNFQQFETLHRVTIHSPVIATQTLGFTR